MVEALVSPEALIAIGAVLLLAIVAWRFDVVRLDLSGFGVAATACGSVPQAERL